MVRFASTFLSHSWAQKPVVEQVAREMLRRGVLAWMDSKELDVGVDLNEALRREVRDQATLTAFISKESVASDWCREELAGRLDAARATGNDAILPVFMGNPMALVQSSPVLRDRWLTPDGRSVQRLGIPADDLATVQPDEIARRLVRAIFGHIGTRDARQIILVLDQRGRGPRAGLPALPENWRGTPWPALVFRPDAGERAESETRYGAEWEAIRDATAQAIGDAFGTRGEREVYVTGNAQLALAWLIGLQLDRSSGARLVTHNRRNGQFMKLDFGDQRFLLPLPRVPASSVEWKSAPPKDVMSPVSAYLGHEDYEHHVLRHREQTADSTPLAVRHTGIIASVDEIIELASWLATVTQGRPLVLYTGLPFHGILILAALLKHVVGATTLMEWDRDARTYHPCPMQ